MTDNNHPPARERNRFGLRPFATTRPPEPTEALFDKVMIRVGGSVRACDTEAFAHFMARIGASATPSAAPTPRLFGTGSWNGNHWIARRVRGSTISGGELRFHRNNGRFDGAEISLVLRVNPIRTLSHLLDRHRFSDILDLDPFEFFRPTTRPSAAGRTLDGKDNMVTDFVSFGSSVHPEMVQRVATYLGVFERALMWRVAKELCPEDLGYSYIDDSGEIIARNEGIELRLGWNTLSVSQCEVCWERHDAEALVKVNALAKQIVDSARVAEVRKYSNHNKPRIHRALGAISVKVPLVPKEKIVLAIYAKATDRIRIEVRYRSDVPQDVRKRLSGSPQRLNDWFSALSQDAASRVRWPSLQGLLTASADATTDALLDLLVNVADVTDKCKNKRRGLLEQLLRHGAATATNRDGDNPASVMERLQNRGIVEHVRLVGKDAKIGRRYRLATRYAGLVDQFALLAVAEPINLDVSEP